MGTDRPVGVSRLVGVLSIRTSSILGSAAKRRHPANAPTTLKTTDSVYGVPIPFVRVLGFLLWFWFGSFLVLDDAICVVGECGFSQCAVPRSTVPFPMTPPYVGRGVIFLLKLFFTHDSRYAPWLAHTGREYHTALWRPTSCCVTVRLRTELLSRIAFERLGSPVRPKRASTSRSFYFNEVSRRNCSNGARRWVSSSAYP